MRERPAMRGTDPASADGNTTLELSRIAARGDARQYIVGQGTIAVNSASASAFPVPHELPPDVHSFTGRTVELGELDGMLEQVDRRNALTSAVISGTGGVGKTGLAVHWGHRVRHRFPDGELYVNLHGYGPGRPLAPMEALAHLLASFGLGENDLPQRLHERASRYRSLLHEKRMLILLDNAASTEQIRDLLPGAPSCAVVVTSRERLDGFAAQFGSRRINLDVLHPEDSQALLWSMVGGRDQSEHSQAGALAAVCGRLPLAIRIAATNAANRPGASLAEIADELRDAFAHNDLTPLATGDDVHTDLRAVFSWSLRGHPASIRRAFMLIGVCPIACIDLYGVAALLGTDVREARQVSEVLVRAHLLTQRSGPRYVQHDLLRSYARGLAHELLSREERDAALLRFLCFHAHTASLAMNAYIPSEQPLRPDPPAVSTPHPTFANAAEAVVWLEAERRNLIAGALYAAAHGFPEHTCHIAVTIFRYLDICGNLYHNEQLQTTACEVASETQRARSFEYLALIHGRRARFDLAAESTRKAIAIAREQGDRSLEAGNLINLGYMHGRFGEHEQNLACQRAAMAMILETGPLCEINRAHSQLGAAYLAVGEWTLAEKHLDTALRMAEEETFEYRQAMILNRLGILHIRTDRIEVALQYLERSRALFDAMGNRGDLHRTVNNIGNAHRALGHLEKAEHAHREALEMARDYAIIDSEVVILNDLGQTLAELGRRDEAHSCHLEVRGLAKLHGYGDELKRAEAAIRTLERGRA